MQTKAILIASKFVKHYLLKIWPGGKTITNKIITCPTSCKMHVFPQKLRNCNCVRKSPISN